MQLHHKLLHAITEFDRKESTKQGYNRYALAICIGRLHEVENDIASGTSVRDALVAGFTGRLLTKLLKVVGETPDTDADRRWYGGYCPVSKRRNPTGELK